MNTRDNSNLIDGLKKKLAECRQELLAILGDWHYMQYELQPRLNYEYECIFGDLEYLIEDKDRKAGKLERRLEMLENRCKRGDKINELTIDFVNKAVDNELRKIEELKGGYFNSFIVKSNNTHVNFTIKTNSKYSVPQFKKIQKLSGANGQETTVSGIYRKLVKVLHPDVAENKELFEHHWDKVQNTYKANDLEHLSLLQKTICPDEPSEYNDIIAEENSLKKEIRELEISILKERNKIEALKQQEPFVFEDKLSDNIWVAKRKKLLRDKLFSLDKQIISKSSSLRRLTGSTKASQVE